VIIVTADTNVFVSGLEFGGVPLDFLDHARAGAFRLAVSGPLLAELREVLRLKFAWSEEAITAALSQLDDCSVHVQPAETLDVIQDDPDDNRILECAVAAQAGFIVSGDNHLLRLGRYRSIRILKVADFMALLPTL
jgi:putative PIN family toxin of toxin-antitoxin system